MTRIIAGTSGGRRLVVPGGALTRPTSDRVREALFSRLEHQGWLDGTAVLDLYAGSGALGLEAASRGASCVVLVEQAAAPLRALRANVAALRMLQVRVVGDSVQHVLDAEEPPYGPFDLALADPPYPEPEHRVARVLASLADRWLSEDALVVLERSTRSPEPAWPAGLTRTDERRYGETTLWFARTHP
ncbi:MAG TPA: 16S rRNA (guanine(966)-N(2))-methyltransferase RsmD [Actinomycetales bacterium]|nr:16S rRNA (guanine(966)-N(2))-methyltransferase RsmD [Actinomycetales bacterium]